MAVLAPSHGARRRSTTGRGSAKLAALYARTRELVRPIFDLLPTAGRRPPLPPTRRSLHGCTVRYATSRSWGMPLGERTHLLAAMLGKRLPMALIPRMCNLQHLLPRCSSNASFAAKPIPIARGVTTSLRPHTNVGKSTPCYAPPMSAPGRTRAASLSRMAIQMWTSASLTLPTPVKVRRWPYRSQRQALLWVRQ